MICKHCGAEIQAGEQICSYCDCKAEPEIQQFEQPKTNEGSLPEDYFRTTYNSNSYNINSKDIINLGLIIISLLIPIAGIVLGLSNMSGGKRKAGIIYLILGGVALLLSFFSWFGNLSSVIF